jgi:signal transduction histidine kinase
VVFTGRRIWPAVLATAAIAVFASYLAYTQYLVGKFNEQAAINSRIYSQVQQGLLSASGTGIASDEFLALFEIQGLLGELQLPLVLRSANGEYVGINLPFEDEARPGQTEQQRLADYMEGLERTHPENVTTAADGSAIAFGDTAIRRWLDWLPWLQLSSVALLVAVAAVVLRSESRAARERLWSAMARELAHQMGTPLSSLEGWLEVLALPPQERETFAEDEYIARVMSADVERLERVSRRFELIGKPPALDVVSVEEVVNELQDYFGPRLPKFGKGIRIRTRVRGKLPRVRANRVLLAWALENVVKNAVDALAGRGGRILLLAHTGNDGNVHVHIGDDGPGIELGLRERIFEPGVTTKSGGWGVGLSLTRRIVQDLHGGRITAHARRSRGTVFDISLPAVSA